MGGQHAVVAGAALDHRVVEPSEKNAQLLEEVDVVAFGLT